MNAGELELIEYDDCVAFHDAVMPILSRNEAINCMPIALTQRLARDGYGKSPFDDLDRPMIWTVQRSATIELISIQTIREVMHVCAGPEEAVGLVAERMAERNWNGHAIGGVVPTVDQLARLYATRSQRAGRPLMRMAIYQLDNVIRPKPASGSMRPATFDDESLLMKWVADYDVEIGLGGGGELAERVKLLINNKRAFFGWTPSGFHGGLGGPTPNGIRVNYVYTPTNCCAAVVMLRTWWHT